MLLTIFALHKQHLADGIIGGRDGEVTVIEFLTDPSVDIHISANALNSIERANPSTQFGIAAEEMSI